MRIIVFGTKIGLMSGICYVTSQYGVWRDSKRSEEIYKEMYTFLSPYIKEVPVEMPDLPKTSEVTSAVKGYWNHGVVTSAQFLANLPGNAISFAQKGTSYVVKFVNDSTTTTGEEKQ